MPLLLISARRLRLLASLVLAAHGTFAVAGERPQVDLSVRVSMAPATFVPGGHNVFSVTVHNAGPNNAGTNSAIDRPIGVFGSSIVFPPDQSPPLEILGILTGDCGFFRFSEPLPNGNWVVQFSYFFDPLAVGESRTCTSDIEFSSQSTIDITTGWRVVSPRDADINPSNNVIAYTFVAAPPAPSASVPVPATSPISWLLLGLGLLLTILLVRRHAH